MILTAKAIGILGGAVLSAALLAAGIPLMRSNYDVNGKATFNSVPVLGAEVCLVNSNAYLKLADLCHQAVALMKQPMKEAANVALCEQLTNALGRCSSLSVASRDEAQGIIDALSQQKQVRDELVAFLDKIPDEMVCLGTEDLRAELMKTRLFTEDYKAFLKGGSLYNPYYEAINLAVKKVYDDLKENGDEKIENLQTEDLFKAYFRELKKKF